MRQALYIVIALALAAGLGALWMHSRDGDREALDRIDLLAHHIRTTDSIFVTDTLYFNRTLKVAANARYDAAAAREDVRLHLTDTIYVLRALAKDSTALAKDSVTIRSCQSIVLDCSTMRFQRDSVIAQYRKLKPSRISLGIQATCGYGLGGKGTCVVGLGGSFALTR